MTQERYQEAAEWLESVSGFEHSHCAVAAKVMRKLASGWVLVPAKPTERMIAAGIEAYQGKCEDSYRAMIAAAPKP